MEPHYEQHYYFCDIYGGKKYIAPDGTTKEFGYAEGGIWNFQGYLNKLIVMLGKPESVLDLGAGCGGWVATCKANGIDALGLEFSQYAIDHAVLNSAPLLKHWDLDEIPWPVDKQYDWITAIDLFEHLFDDRVNNIIKETKRVASKYIIAKICTAQRSKEVWAAKRAPYEEVVEQAKKEDFEWLIASGHVNSQFPSYWLQKFVDNDWKNRADIAERFKIDLSLPEDWRTTLFLKKYAFEL